MKRALCGESDFFQIAMIAVLFSAVVYFAFIAFFVVPTDELYRRFPGRKLDKTLLNDPKRDYMIACEGDRGAYVLKFDPPGENWGGYFIGNSSKDLFQFCNTKVRITATVRDEAGYPLFFDRDKGTVSNSAHKTAVIDIQSVELDE